MPRRDEVLAAMRDALILQDPEWDITPGTAEYKILEAVAQQVENISFNSVLNDYHFDVDKKSGLELDLFMSLFGFARIKARRATGEVTFQRGTAAVQDYVIPAGTQVFVPATSVTPAIYFQTTVSGILPTGSTEVSIPVQSVVGGTIGNVGAAQVTGMATSIGGVTAVFNAQSISGGRDAESDIDLRDRWKRSVFRNISGTEDQFLGIAFNESAFVTRANLVGPIERYLEQIQLSAPEDLTVATPWQTTISGNIGTGDTAFSVANGDVFSEAPFWAAITTGSNPIVFQEIIYVGTKVANALSNVVRSGSYDPANNGDIRQIFPSAVPDSAFTYSPGGEIVGTDIGRTSQQIGRRETDYWLITAANDSAAVDTIFPLIYVTSTGATNFALDSIIQLEHEYTPIASRNDPDTQIADKVDMFVDGVDPISVSEQVPMRTTDSRFGFEYTIADYMRDDGVDAPDSGNYFTPLSKAPISELPSSISVDATASADATVYYKDEDYWLVANEARDGSTPSKFEGSPRASNGIEWRVPGATQTGVFSATRQAVAGKLVGWYGYVVTYEIDGVETLADADTPEAADDINIAATFGRNDLVVPVWAGAGSVKWRKIYRSLGAASAAAAITGPFYLLTVIKNNTVTAFEDNKRDDALDLEIQPPKSPPAAGTPLTVAYSYNHLIERIDAQVDLVRLVGMDTLVHKSDDINLKFNLAIVLIPGMNVSDVTADIETNLFAWINRKGFQNNVQIADVIDVVSNASGVDNVRLVAAGEEKNDAQKVTATPTTASPDADRDQFTITIGSNVSALISYNESAVDVREILEAMPNIHEGNTYATQLNGAITSSATTIQVDDVGSLHVGGNPATTTDVIGDNALDRVPLYLQIDSEIMLVTDASDAGGNIDYVVKRGQLGSAAVLHGDNADVHLLGDVAVSRAGAGTSGNPYIWTVSFLPNGFTNINDWGTREVTNVTLTKKNVDTTALTLTVTKKVQGVGSGIQQIADNDQTIVTTYYDDFYLSSDELPTYFSTDVVTKAQNTF